MTWGISDTLFLAAYGVIAGASVLGALGWRWYVTSGGDRDHEPSAVELGYLVDGPLGACYVSIAGLWRARAVAQAPFSTVASHGEPPAGASRLTRALHQALRTPKTWTAVVVEGSVGQALGELKRRLTRRGWLIDERRARRARLVAAPLSGVAAAGLVRLVAVVAQPGTDVRPGADVGLAFAVAATGVVAAGLVRRPRISTVARREVRWARGRRRYLSPHGNHNWQAANPRDLMFAVALYGAPVLRVCDPAFARVVGADPQERAREPVDVELAVADGFSHLRRRRRRIRLWGAGPVPQGVELGWLPGSMQPSWFWRLMWRLRQAWGAGR